ncbi:MAG: hypothetical protein HY757_09145 [Nitrospirae bacterium]|nr:hypothetical protein [Nitrospirota bacterium]
MKNLLAGMAVLLIISAGALAFAHGPGGRGHHMTVPGYRGQMMGPGFGSPMMGVRGPGYGPGQTFLNETVDLRRELHNKKFEYFEASRDPETTVETLSKLEKEIYDVKSRIREKAPRTMNRGFGRSGRCW